MLEGLFKPSSIYENLVRNGFGYNGSRNAESFENESRDKT